MTKKYFNIIRNNYVISKLLRTVLKPMQRLCNILDRQIKMKVWANGEAVNYDGLSIQFPKNIGVGFCSNIYWNGVDGFEPRTWRIIRHFIECADYFIDIGSNIGFYSVLAMKVKPAIKLSSFEPIPSIYEKNVFFHRANGFSFEHVVNAAISESNGESEIYLPIADESLEEQMTATLRKDSWQFNKKHSTFIVRTMKLDDIVKKAEPCDKLFIKIDVEDYELGVFKGAIETLHSVKPIIVCEILPRSHGNRETVEILDNNGYIAFGIAVDGLIKF